MTRRMYLIAGVAGLALTAPATAEKGGRDRDKAPQEAQQGGGQPSQRQERQVQREERQQSQRAERPQRVERQQIERAERPQRIERQEMRRAERPQRIEHQEIQRAERPQRIERQQQRTERRVERPQRIEREQQRAERQAQRVERPRRIEQRQQRSERQAQRIERQAQRVEQRAAFRPQKLERQQQRIERRQAEQLIAPRGDDRTTARFDGRRYRPVAPFLATRDMRPMEPFQAKIDARQGYSIGERVDDNRYLTTVPTFYGRNYVDTSDYYHRYDNDLGYVYRISRDGGIVNSLFPLFGGYGIGDPWPQTYYSSYVPAGYRDYYYDTPDHYYRNDGYGIYQVDGTTQLITALVSLVFGQGYGVGQTLPASYGVYNVPLDYRANYYDTDDSAYRYGDGFIYQMDPDSRRIAARYPVYGDDYYVGDAWPSAYPDYNVPYGYRSAYYDTPQYQYRYANNGIYQVDPTSQVIMALVALVTGNQFAVGQQMPGGYDTYNVPLDYRDRYADSDSDWYRYANGNVYRVDAGSGLIEEAYPIYG